MNRVELYRIKFKEVLGECRRKSRSTFLLQLYFKKSKINYSCSCKETEVVLDV